MRGNYLEMFHFISELTQQNIEDFIFARTTNIVAAYILIYVAISYFGFKKREVFSDEAVRNTLASVCMLGANVLLLPIILIVSNFLQKSYDSLGIAHVPVDFWSGFPVIAVALIGFAAKDFVDYWNHRLMHTKWVWPIHAVHHSDTHVNGFTAFRVHLFELVYMKLSYVLALSWLGFPPEQIAVIYLFESLHVAYVHIEHDIDHGSLNWLLASPRFHRWHHADNPVIFGKNLANHIPLYDMMFGTYHNPGTCHEPMGALSDAIPDKNVFKLFALPFVLWRKRLAKNFTPSIRRMAQRISML